MTSHTIYILPSISRSKGNQAIKFDRSIKYNVTNIFLKTHAENEVRTLVPNLLLFIEKALYKVKASGQHLIRPRLGHTIETSFIKFENVDPEICSILMFWKKSLGLAPPPHFAYDFSRRIFLMLYFMN